MADKIGWWIARKVALWGSKLHDWRMGKFIDVILWFFIEAAEALWMDLIEVFSRGELTGLVVLLGTAVILLEIWRGITSCWARLSTKSGMAKLDAVAPPKGLIADAHQNPGAGIHIAKLLSKVTELNEADEIWDIFKDALPQRNKATAYAAYAHALVRFDCCMDATEILGEAYQVGVPQAEMEAAMDRFYSPEEDGYGR